MTSSSHGLDPVPTVAHETVRLRLSQMIWAVSVNGHLHQRNRMHSKSKSSRRLLQLGLCLGFIIVQLDVSVVNVGLDALRHSFDANLADLEWVINAYALVFAAFLLASGPLSERFGARRVFLSGVITFVLASLGCAASPTLPILIAFRCIQGLGASMLVPTSLTLLRNEFDDPVERASAIGTWGSSGALALAAGPIVGGYLISTLGWASIFLLNIPIGLAVVWLTVRNSAANRPGRTRLDLVAQALIVMSLGLLTFGLTESARYGWQDTLTAGTVVVGVILLVVFLCGQGSAKRPILPPALFRIKEFSGATFATVVSSLAFYGIVFVLSLYFQDVLGMSASETGLGFVPMMLATSAGTFLAGPLAARVSLSRIVPLGMGVSITGFIGLCFATDAWGYARIVWATLPLGFGTSMVVPSLVGAMFAVVPKAQAGTASSVFASARQVGGVVGVSMFGFVIARSGHAMTSLALNRISLICAVLIAMAGLVGCIAMQKRSDGAQREHEFESQA